MASLTNLDISSLSVLPSKYRDIEALVEKIRSEHIQKHKLLRKTKVISEIQRHLISPSQSVDNTENEAFVPQQEKHPFSIFKLDVWDLILNQYISDPRTWLNCMYASAAFREEEKVFKWQQSRITRLLPKVLIFLKQTKPYSKSPYISEKDVKTLRFVGKNWCRVVEQYWTDRSSKDDKQYTYEPCRSVVINNAKLDKILAMRVELRPHFIKKLYLVFTCVKNSPDVVQMVEYIGQGLHTFTLIFQLAGRDELPNAGIWYNLLYKCLSFMPNLKQLDLHLPNVDKLSGNYRTQFAHFAKNIEEMILTAPLPNLSQLKGLGVDYCVPNQLVLSILSTSTRLENLRALEKYPNEESYHIFPPFLKNCSNFSLKLLSELHIGYHFDTFPMSLMETECFSTLKKVTWPLRKLTLKLSETKHSFHNIQYLFDICNRFGGTLVDLTIPSSQWTRSTKVNKLELLLPRLEQLDLGIMFPYNPVIQRVGASQFHNGILMSHQSETMRGNQVQVDFDFLLSLPLLQKLVLHLTEYIKNTHEIESVHEAVQLQGYFDKLEESQIWNVLPYLHTVAYEFHDSDGTDPIVSGYKKNKYSDGISKISSAELGNLFGHDSDEES